MCGENISDNDRWSMDSVDGNSLVIGTLQVTRIAATEAWAAATEVSAAATEPWAEAMEASAALTEEWAAVTEASAAVTEEWAVVTEASAAAMAEWVVTEDSVVEPWVPVMEDSAPAPLTGREATAMALGISELNLLHVEYAAAFMACNVFIFSVGYMLSRFKPYLE